MKVNSPCHHEALAWAAGIFEGEGSICIRKNGRVDLAIQSTDLDTLKRFHRVIGTGRVRGPYTSSVGRKLVWHWAVANRAGAVYVLRELWRWLGSRRHERAKQALLALGEVCPSDDTRYDF